MLGINIGTPIKQGDPAHADVKLGNGSDTIGRSGCLLACLTMAARFVQDDHDMTIIEANRIIRDAGGFSGSRLVRAKAAHALGLDIGAWESGYDHAEVVEALSDGCPVIIGIDYRDGSSSAKSEADHFVLAVFCTAATVHVADPATGVLESLSTKDTVYRGRPARLAESLTLMVASHA